MHRPVPHGAHRACRHGGARGARSAGVEDFLRGAAVTAGRVGDAEDPRPDLALLTIDDALIDLPPMPLAAVDRSAGAAEVLERCHAIGYP